MNDNTFATIYDLLYSASVTSNKELSNFVINQLYLSTNLDVDEQTALNSYIASKEEVNEMGKKLEEAEANAKLEKEVAKVTSVLIMING